MWDVFICYAREDVEMATRLYDDLERAGVSPWLDRKKLLPGQNWKRAIKQAMKDSAYVLALLSSNSVSKTGYVQKELKEALDLLDLRSPSKIFIIPARIEECEPDDERLQDIHWVDLFESYDEGLALILQVLVSDRKEMPGAGTQESAGPPPKQNRQAEHVTQKGTNKREAGKDYFEHVAGNVYTGPVTIHQHVEQQDPVTIHQHVEQQEPEKQEAKPRSKQKPARKVQKPPIISLRSEPLIVPRKEFREVFKLNKNRRPLKYIHNQFENQGEVVLDHATGLMWQKAGSEKDINYGKAQEYVEELNRQKFAGYDDWRLPTIPELMSLLEPEKQSDNLYIDPIFDSEQWWCWSADLLPEGEESSSGSAWYISFYNGNVSRKRLDYNYYVRCVCSRK